MENAGKVNHVEIVSRVEDRIIYTAEGNSTNDMYLEQDYPIDSKLIYGFGTPNY